MSGDAQSPILVFQMGKVASVSWYEAIRATLPGTPVHHFHLASPTGRARVEALRDVQGPLQTIARRNVPFLWGLPPAEVLSQLQSGRWTGAEVRIIAGIRDPVDRSCSSLQFGADFMGHTELKLTAREHGSPESLAEVFRRGWEEALGGPTSADTFGRFLALSFGNYRTWFDDELAAVFGLDVMTAPFDREGLSLQVDCGSCRLFVYRTEDLADPGRAQRVLASACTWLGQTLPELTSRNAAEGRRSRDLYRAFRARARLPEPMLARIYDVPVLRHFYEADEIASFGSRWRGG
jgi:hypothetical protein